MFCLLQFALLKYLVQRMPLICYVALMILSKLEDWKSWSVLVICVHTFLKRSYASDAWLWRLSDRHWSLFRPILVFLYCSIDSWVCASTPRFGFIIPWADFTTHTHVCVNAPSFWDNVGKLWISCAIKIVSKSKYHSTVDDGLVFQNGERRRTPGGVYLFLLKNTSLVSKEQYREIFRERCDEQKRIQKQVKKRRWNQRISLIHNQQSELMHPKNKSETITETDHHPNSQTSVGPVSEDSCGGIELEEAGKDRRPLVAMDDGMFDAFDGVDIELDLWYLDSVMLATFARDIFSFLYSLFFFCYIAANALFLSRRWHFIIIIICTHLLSKFCVLKIYACYKMCTKVFRKCYITRQCAWRCI